VGCGWWENFIKEYIMSKKVDTLVQDIYRTIDEGLDKRKTDKLL